MQPVQGSARSRMCSRRQCCVLACTAAEPNSMFSATFVARTPAARLRFAASLGPTRGWLVRWSLFGPAEEPTRTTSAGRTCARVSTPTSAPSSAQTSTSLLLSITLIPPRSAQLRRRSSREGARARRSYSGISRLVWVQPAAQLTARAGGQPGSHKYPAPVSWLTCSRGPRSVAHADSEKGKLSAAGAGWIPLAGSRRQWLNRRLLVVSTCLTCAHPAPFPSVRPLLGLPAGAQGGRDVRLTSAPARPD